ncbi:hypothetical protein VNO77_30523 [Canavalia gladiata]|uniref:Uncharacterized protein n=1 Tax=Canavalia gladiata TaxID=3824 RepID=A0AAN9KN37_CANGL
MSVVQRVKLSQRSCMAKVLPLYDFSPNSGICSMTGTGVHHSRITYPNQYKTLARHWPFCMLIFDVACR